MLKCVILEMGVWVIIGRDGIQLIKEVAFSFLPPNKNIPPPFLKIAQNWP